jgi:hypothetical protein
MPKGVEHNRAIDALKQSSGYVRGYAQPPSTNPMWWRIP